MLYRFYHTSFVALSVKKQGVKLCKMINPKNNRQWYPTPGYDMNTMPSIKSLTKTKNEPGKRGVRRLGMLNKMFMKHITDLMSTGTVSMNIIGRGIEISKVQVSPDFHTVSVYWVCKGNSSDEDTENLLNKTAGALRHELSTLRVMGEVPYIVFVKDKQEAQLVDLDRRLAEADYGMDFEPTELGHLLKTEFTLNTKLSPEMLAKIKQLEDESPHIEDPIPEMTHTVFGLDHAKIMNRLLAARKKSKDAWTNITADSPVISYRAPEDYDKQESNVVTQRQELADFLHKRQILQNKLHKQSLETRDDWQLQLQSDDDDDEPMYDDVDDDDDDGSHEDNDFEHETTRVRDKTGNLPFS